MAAADRILTTRTGSLPRPAPLTELLEAVYSGAQPDAALLAIMLDDAVAEACRCQLDSGIDIISDGEQGQLSFFDTWGRLSGFCGPVLPFIPADLRGLPPLFDVRRVAQIQRSHNDGSTTWQPGPLDRRLRRFTAVLDNGQRASGAFLSAPSPGILARLGTGPGSSFTSHEKFVDAIAGEMRREYLAITRAGLQLQVDCPDLAMCRHTDYQASSIAEFRDIAAMHVRALNRALDGIPAEQVRIHVCWGNYPGPHHHDVPLDEIIDILYAARAGTLVLEQANARHRHEWQVFRDHPLPDHMVLAAGVIDNSALHVEHPQAVSEALIRLAGIVGKDRLMATTDCGFATFAAAPSVPATVAYLKLAALAEGARLASGWLWP